MTTTFNLTRGSVVETFSLTDLKNMCDCANRDLAEAIYFNDGTREQIIAGKDPVGCVCYHIPRTMVAIAKRYGLANLNVSKFGVGWSAQAAIDRLNNENVKLKRYIKRNNEFVTRASKDMIGFYDYMTIPLSMPTGTLKPVRIILVYKSNKETCTLCGDNVSRDRLNEHQKTERCRRKVKLKQLADKGLVPVQDYKIIKAVKAGAIPGEAVPIKYRWYTPAWVIDAAKLYDRNHGYANMSFEEFLVRMGPNKH
jgi:hypothetical protein